MSGEAGRPLLGRLGEALACEFLKMQGFRVIDRNYRCAEGEVDIIAEEGETLAFVEVRTKTSDEYGLPLETIGAQKRARLRRATLHYLAKRGPSRRCLRFDAVGILFREGEEPVIELVRNAFYGGMT